MLTIGWIRQLASADTLAPRTRLTAFNDTGVAIFCVAKDILNLFV